MSDETVMLEKPPVLISDEHRDVARIDVMRGRRQSPASVGQSEGPKQPAIAIDDDRRAFARRGKIERAETCGVTRPGEGRTEACHYKPNGNGCDGDEDQAVRGARHIAPSFAGETLIRPCLRRVHLPPEGEGLLLPSPSGRRWPEGPDEGLAG